MAFGFAVLCGVLAVASAGYLGTPAVHAPAVASYGIGVPAIGYSGGYGGYAGYGIHHGGSSLGYAAAPAVAYSAPAVGYAAPAIGYGGHLGGHGLAVGYAAAPAIAHYSPASAVSYSNTYKTAIAAPAYGGLSYGLGGHYGYAGTGW